MQTQARLRVEIYAWETDRATLDVISATVDAMG